MWTQAQLEDKIEQRLEQKRECMIFHATKWAKQGKLLHCNCLHSLLKAGYNVWQTLWNDSSSTNSTKILKTKLVSFSELLNCKTRLWKACSYCWLNVPEIMWIVLWLFYSENFAFCYSSMQTFLQNNVSDVFKYFIASNLKIALAEVTQLYPFLLTVPTTSVSIKQSFCALKKVHNET
jgi:hypothetical protein